MKIQQPTHTVTGTSERLVFSCERSLLLCVSEAKGVTCEKLVHAESVPFGFNRFNIFINESIPTDNNSTVLRASNKQTYMKRSGVTNNYVVGSLTLDF